MCTIAPETTYGWLCESMVIPERYFDTASRDLPIERIPNTWWQCGCEDKNTYTQAFCK